MPRTIQVPATLDSAVRKKDRSVKFTFTTMREISTDEYMVMDSYYQSAGHLLFRENEFREEDIPQEDVETDIAKSQSTQLRDALWILFKAKGYDTQDKERWNIFYRQNMQAIKARVLETVHDIEGK